VRPLSRVRAGPHRARSILQRRLLDCRIIIFPAEGAAADGVSGEFSAALPAR